jgi:hypothetical protein
MLFRHIIGNRYINRIKTSLACTRVTCVTAADRRGVPPGAPATATM